MRTKTMAVVTVVLAVLVVMLAHSACTPRVTIVGDKDHPIPINAEIKIHIYQHAAENVDKMMEGLEEPEEAEEADEDSASASFLTRVIETVSVGSAYAAEPVDEALAKAKELYQKAFPMLKKGLLGENREGYVAVVNKAANATAEELAAAAKMAAELNTARKKLYESDAKKLAKDFRAVQEGYAKAFREKSPKGVWVEMLDEKTWVWKQK